MTVRHRGTLHYEGDVRGRTVRRPVGGGVYVEDPFVVGVQLGCAVDLHPYVVTEIAYDETTGVSTVTIERASSDDVLRWDRARGVLAGAR